MSALSQFSTFFQGGGAFMYAILALGVVLFGTALERFWVIARASSWNGDKLARDLCDRIQKGDLRSAYDIASKVASPTGRVAAAIIAANTTDDDALLNAADGEAAMVLPPLSRRLPMLNLFANTATLLGLLGTIFGLTTAFAAVGAADPSQRSAFLAAGISQALNTTAFGLIVAVPGMLVHGFLAGRVERIVEQVDSVSVRVMRAMSRAGSHPHAATAQPAASPAAQSAATSAPRRAPVAGAPRQPTR
jgi:biopolymer transport protein ExbB